MGGAAVTLDSLLETAQTHGFPGGGALVLRILQVGGWFEIGALPHGGLAVRRKS